MCHPLDKNCTKIIKYDVKCIYYLNAIKSSHHYLYSAFYNADCVKAALQY